MNMSALRKFRFVFCRQTPLNMVGFVCSRTFTSNAKSHKKRKYISRMCLYPPSTEKEELLKCNSQELFFHNEMLYPCHPGAFYYLPLGLRAFEKLVRLIDEELQAIGAQKISMPTLVPGTLWKQTGRWDNTELFKLKDRHSKDYCLGPTHEELVTTLMAQIQMISHKRLPVMLYQITRKFRDEKHPKHGLLRGREFEMKDLYTFDTCEDSARETYARVCDTYHTIFDRLGLKHFKVEGSVGNIGGKLSHEFHLQSGVGEDTLYICDSCGFGSNAELIETESEASREEIALCPKCASNMSRSAGIEVGHAFLLGTKYSQVLKATYINQSQKNTVMEMGCYGLGVSRILQASVEVLMKEEKIRWPSIIAPYQVCILPQKQGYMSEKFLGLADDLSDTLTSLPNLRGEVVIDDRTNTTVGKRLYQANRQGYPYAVVIGRKSLEEPSLYEFVDIVNDSKQFMSLDQLVDRLSTIETI